MIIGIVEIMRTYGDEEVIIQQINGDYREGQSKV
jgi:hypothetical protein